MAEQGYHISDWDPLANPKADVVGAVFELEILGGPGGQRLSRKITWEQLSVLIGESDAGGASLVSLSLAQAQGLNTADIKPASLYAITGSWNGLETASTVYLVGLTNDWAPQGIAQVGEDKAQVTVDVAAGTYAPVTVDAYSKEESDEQASNYLLKQYAEGVQVVESLVSFQDDIDAPDIIVHDAPQGLRYYTELAAAVQAFKSAKLYPEIGQNTDGAMTQKASSDAFALKANLSDIIWRYIGDHANNNFILGEWYEENVLGAGSRNNIFYRSTDIEFGLNCTSNSVAANGTVELGDNSRGNVIGYGTSGIAFGKGAIGNRIEALSVVVEGGDNVQHCRTLSGSRNILFGNNCQYCSTDQASQFVTFGPGCQRVTVLATRGTSTATFVVPEGTMDATYRNGQLVTTDGGGPSYTAGTGIAISSQNVISATGGGGGIDYANPVTLTAAAALQANKAYHVTGSGYQLTLPNAATAGGGGIFIEIASDATGLYQLANGATLALYAGETMLLRATPSGWKKAGGELLAMETRIETALNQQPALYDGLFIPFSVPKSVSYAPLADLSSNGIRIQRNGRGSIQFGVVLNNIVGNYFYFQIQAVLPGGGVVALNGGFATVATNQGTSTANVSLPVPTASYQAGTFLRVQLFLGQGSGGNIQGGSDGNQAYFTYSENV